MASSPFTVSQEVPHGATLIGGLQSLVANRRRVLTGSTTWFFFDLREDDFLLKKYHQK